MRALVGVAAAALALAAPAAAGLDRSAFRYERTLRAPGGGPIALEPDGALFAHAGPDLAGLRVVDAHGDQVPWRPLPDRAAAPPERVRVLNAGRRGSEAVALLDLGARRSVHDRVDLDVPGRGFVGRVVVLGSDDRRTFTRLGSSRIFDLAGAAGRARSTTVTFAPSDFRYLELRATGIAAIAGATVSGRAQRPELRAVPARVRIANRGRTTLVTLDLGHANVPVDELRVTAATPRYDRPVEIEAGNRRIAVEGYGGGRAYRYFGTSSPPLRVDLQVRYVELAIRNGDDPPLRGIRVAALAAPRTLLVEGGHPAPLRLLYGGRPRGAPDYDYARLPRRVLELDRVQRGALGPEALNARFRRAPDTRTWVARHSAVVSVALAVAAIAVAAAGFLALRRRT